MKTVLCFGDSNTWGYDPARYDMAANFAMRHEFDVRWPGLVQTALKDEVRIIEDAINGRTSMKTDDYMPFRRGLDGANQAVLIHTPYDIVIVQLGCNDFKQQFNLLPGQIARGIETVTATLAAKQPFYPAPKVLLISPHPFRPNIFDLRLAANFGPTAYERSCQLGGLLKATAERRGWEFIDCAELGFEISPIDGVHYMPEDHAKLAKVVIAKLREMIKD